MESSQGQPQAAGAEPRSRIAGLRHELRTHLFTYLTVAGFVVLGPVLAKMIFPEAPTSLIVVGGVLMGGYFAFNALLHKLMD
jgi:hypothetical protein